MADTAPITGTPAGIPFAYRSGTAPHTGADIAPFFPLVRGLARGLRARLPASVELDDLVQVGLIGLADALGRFDAAQGVKFETFASVRIRGAMLDELRGGDWMSRGDREHQRAIEAARSTLAHQLGRAPSEGETARQLGLSLADYQRQRDRVCDTAQACAEDMDHMADPGPDLVDRLDSARLRQALATAITRLPERHQQVLALVHDDGLRQVEAAAVLDVSPSRVCHLHRQAVERLRGLLDANTIGGAA